ncbi:hypothetical protein HPB48_000659 [Haemaphysalis longicornis]|uniref:Uncharacterized protein n=1 Tax=Haemaphysalis longicornis TaxID=44386 RepID=A0A9J6F9R2_HAELO|nr:hypothetical protein HPB48_000659 [Haemaphysalis longicornis]
MLTVPPLAARCTWSTMKWKRLTILWRPKTRDADFVGCTTAGIETYEEFDEADREADNPDDDFLEYVRINSKIKLPHQTTTRLQAMLLILTFVVAGGLNWTQVDSLFKLLHTLMGKQVFPPSK